jgi:hypothetical protein
MASSCYGLLLSVVRAARCSQGDSSRSNGAASCHPKDCEACSPRVTPSVEREVLGRTVGGYETPPPSPRPSFPTRCLSGQAPHARGSVTVSKGLTRLQPRLEGVYLRARCPLYSALTGELEFEQTGLVEDPPGWAVGRHNRIARVEYSPGSDRPCRLPNSRSAIFGAIHDGDSGTGPRRPPGSFVAGTVRSVEPLASPRAVADRAIRRPECDRARAAPRHEQPHAAAEGRGGVKASYDLARSAGQFDGDALEHFGR